MQNRLRFATRQSPPRYRPWGLGCSSQKGQWDPKLWGSDGRSLERTERPAPSPTRAAAVPPDCPTHLPPPHCGAPVGLGCRGVRSARASGWRGPRRPGPPLAPDRGRRDPPQPQPALYSPGVVLKRFSGRHRLVGVVQSALRSLRQPEADKGRSRSPRSPLPLPNKRRKKNLQIKDDLTGLKTKWSSDLEHGEFRIRSWDTNLIECNLDQELKLFVSRHSARFSPEVPGEASRSVSISQPRIPKDQEQAGKLCLGHGKTLLLLKEYFVFVTIH
ncbi:hypothetical protein P7K49_004869 [Saguinus oedipus]|uniref:Microtubule-associated protein 1B/S N-terminal domain-containing protein n=1 Tax=Saguinus oedipus TaxID=9490 RepID=A0ABQ9WC88_SAGOE|nr:hypothetical protein P7K49_004869 [Saguinus oedipus]